MKRFRVPTGSVIIGAEFLNNDDRTVFPSVALLRGPATRLSEATVLAEFAGVRSLSQHRVRVATSPITVESPEEFYVAVRFPASTGVRSIGDGPGIGAVQLDTFGDCYVAPTTEEAFQAIDLDVAIRLLYRTVGKAETSEDTGAILRTFLATVAPNPATTVARVQFGLERRVAMKLAVYNVAGRLVRLLAEGPMDAGVHAVDWDGKDEHGRDVAAGVYVAKLQAGDKVLTQKLVIAK